jgi:hypothetical protein
LDPEEYAGEVVGNGQCVAFVKEASGAPQTSLWREGVKVRGATTLVRGTAIATFIKGVYPSRPSGNHAAIFVEQNDSGLVVWDQWAGQPVHERTIHFKGPGNHDLVNNGDAYAVIETITLKKSRKRSRQINSSSHGHR